MRNRRKSVLQLSCGPNNRANFAAKVDMSRNWSATIDTAAVRLRDVVRRSCGSQTKLGDFSQK